MRGPERLPPGLGAALGGVSLAALLLGAAWAGHGRVGTALAGDAAGLAEIRRERATLEARAAALEVGRPAYAAFLARGLIGEERRLRWLDALSEAARSLAIPRLVYRLEPPGPPSPPGPGAPGAAAPRETRMLLELELRHEAQLLDLLQALETSAGGLHSVAGCSMSRTPAAEAAVTPSLRPDTAALSARCTLLWWTIPPAPVDDPTGAQGV